VFSARFNGRLRHSHYCHSNGSHFRKAEVEDFGMSSFGQEDIRWLDISMDDACAVGGIQRIGDLNAE
jgi:hypothetical protein